MLFECVWLYVFLKLNVWLFVTQSGWFVLVLYIGKQVTIYSTHGSD